MRSAKTNVTISSGWIMAIQWGILLILGVVMAMTKYTGNVFPIVMWVGAPLVGAVAAGWSTRRGLNAYLSWIGPPVCQALSYHCVWAGYGIQPGMVLVNALAAIVGAATGDVANRMKR